MVAALAKHDKAFVRKLKEFAAHGYDFGNGHGHKLRKGTQHEAFNGFRSGLNEGHRHGYFEIPTGVGKTAVFISLIKNYLDAVNGNSDAQRVLIVVPSTDLVVQTAKAFAKFMPGIAPLIETDDDKGKEIGWEKSGVGVQYSSMKHAARKPKVLITTYQSLCQDTGNKTYPPSEYGLVVFDEGHNTTAQKFGLAVDKFEDAIQLAVTATPEYSEDKTVAQKLPHCYFRLPLAEAINRGDLCPVDPVLIRTNYTIDKSKFEKFVAQQDGRFLTKAQYESLLNQEARNAAAIKTYLLGKDPNTGEHYFGQTGMIFGGGIKHCDDFARQINNVINTPQYKPIRDWLKEEGVALVAPLHNKINSVELTIDGQKRAYTKDEVKDLHRRGKVLLLVSDKELKEGTDFPRDSIIMELVDRLSVVDATQRYGRGFRLDLPDPDNNNPKGDPHKRCKVFNLIDKNTYEIYADEPQMLPIYCAEILEGAEFREPLPRTHLLKRFKHDVPDVDDKLEKSGFEVVTDIERVRAVSEGYKKAKLAKAAKCKPPEGYWTGETLGEAVKAIDPSLNSRLGSSIIARIREQHKTRDVATFREIPVPRIAIAEYDNHGNTGYVLREAECKKIVASYASKKTIPDGYWSGTKLGQAVKDVNPNMKTVPATLGGNITTNIRKQHETKKVAIYKDVPVPRAAMAQYESNSMTAYALREVECKKIVAAYEEEYRASQIEVVEPEKKTIPDGYWSGAIFGQAIKDVRPDIRTVPNTLASNITQNIRKQHQTSDTAIYKEVSVSRKAIAQYDSHGRDAYALREAECKKIIAAYAADKTENVDNHTHLKSKPITPRKFPAHMTDEEREKGKRGGRGK